MSKQMIEYEDSVWIDDCITDNRTLGDILLSVQNLISNHGADAQIEFDSGYSNISERIIFKNYREETEEEYKKRLKREGKVEERELKELARLKAKYGEK